MTLSHGLRLIDIIINEFTVADAHTTRHPIDCALHAILEVEPSLKELVHPSNFLLHHGSFAAETHGSKQLDLTTVDFPQTTRVVELNELGKSPKLHVFVTLDVTGHSDLVIHVIGEDPKVSNCTLILVHDNRQRELPLG
eukprot:m.432834 g.432834  ORF g.432834 m.432834 type:complete len:139 (+) comp17496_c0_seq1:1353-1769(+)